MPGLYSVRTSPSIYNSMISSLMFSLGPLPFLAAGCFSLFLGPLYEKPIAKSNSNIV